MAPHRELFHRIGIAILAIVFLPLLLLASPVLVFLLRRHEKRDVPDTSQRAGRSRAPTSRRRRLLGPEPGHRGGPVQTGLFRMFLATAILQRPTTPCATSTTAARSRDSTPFTSRDGCRSTAGRRLFFSSNYDGSLESYMNDFIDKAAWGLNAIFSNGDGFPRTCFLFCGGITDEKAYKRFLPTRQVQSQVWYSAYPHLSTKNIANNAAIRQGLSRSAERRRDEDVAARDSACGNQLPESGLVARILDGFPWDKLCRCCN